jgi:predicted amidohydrolase
MPRPVRLTMLTVHNRLEPMAERRRQVLDLIDQAGRAGSDIVLLPECADHHRTPEAVAAHEQGRAAVRDTLGLDLESPWVGQVADLARRHEMVVVPCIVHNDGPKTYDAALVFGPDGSLLGTYNKSHLAPGEERVFDWGDHLNPIATPFGKLGILICWDIHFPEITRVYELLGADILLWTTMRQGTFERELYHAVLPSRSFTHGLPFGVSTFAQDDQLRHRGFMNSIIIDAFGQTVAGGIQAGNGFVRATIDLDQRPTIAREWNLEEHVDYARYLQTHRRTDLYTVLTAAMPDRDAGRRM